MIFLDWNITKQLEKWMMYHDVVKLVFHASLRPAVAEVQCCMVRVAYHLT